MTHRITFSQYLKLSESDQGQYKNDSAERAMIHKIVELANANGLLTGGKTEANLEKAYDFLESDWGGRLWDKHYELFTQMDPKFEGPFDKKRYTQFKKEAVAWFKNWKNGRKLPDDVKRLDRMHEEVESKSFPRHIKLQGRYVATLQDRTEFSIIYNIEELMGEEPLGLRAGVHLGVKHEDPSKDFGSWFIRPTNMTAIDASGITLVKEHPRFIAADPEIFASWLLDQSRRLKKTGVLEARADYLKAVVYPVSGEWPKDSRGQPDLSKAFTMIDDLVGGDAHKQNWYHRYDIDTNEIDDQLASGGKFEFFYPAGMKLNTAALKKHGLKLDIMSDYEPARKIDENKDPVA